MTDINIAIEPTPYNPCAIRFRPVTHWLARLSRGEATLSWFMDHEARPSADDVVLSIEQAMAFVERHPTLESFARAAELPLARASDLARADQSRQYLLWVGVRWRALCAQPVVAPVLPLVAAKPVVPGRSQLVQTEPVVAPPVLPVLPVLPVPPVLAWG